MVHTRVTRELLTKLLGVTDDGPPFETGKTTVTCEPDWVFETAVHKFCYGSVGRQRMGYDGGVVVDIVYWCTCLTIISYLLLVAITSYVFQIVIFWIKENLDWEA